MILGLYMIVHIYLYIVVNLYHVHHCSRSEDVTSKAAVGDS